MIKFVAQQKAKKIAQIIDSVTWEKSCHPFSFFMYCKNVGFDVICGRIFLDPCKKIVIENKLTEVRSQAE